MDELELLKKNWQKDTVEYPKVSQNEIYKIILKKSSSIVRWIFIISLLEFGFWTLLGLVTKLTRKSDFINEMESSTTFLTISVISYIILGYFFYRFYSNYKSINAADNASVLMKKILKTRQTVKQYVIVNLVFLFIGVFAMFPYILETDSKTKLLLETATTNGEVFKLYAGLIIATLLIIGTVSAILLGFYWLIYGVLLKRLNRNYKELKKMEV